MTFYKTYVIINYKETIGDLMTWVWITYSITFICAIVLGIRLRKKQIIDTRAREQYKKDVENLYQEKQKLKKDLSFYETQIDKEQKRFNKMQTENNATLARQALELENFYETNKQRRIEQLENEMLKQEETKKALLQKTLEQIQIEYENKEKLIENAFSEHVSYLELQNNQFENQIKLQEQRFNSLLEPLRKYDMEQQAKLFYAIQIPEEYHKDIDFLLTTVSQQIQHPDIINKLIWSEYIKPYMDDTLKRVGIEDKPGIYKITNINNGKSYIGKSTNVKKRLQDHIKSSIGITSIADQPVHHEILKEGIWNWIFEVIIYCDKEHLNDLEKYYINFFKTQEYGYNKRQGG